MVKTDNKLVDFVSKEYFKVKKWKKSPKNFQVFEVANNIEQLEYALGTSIVDPKIQCWNSQKEIGNLEELYLDLPNREDNLLTDAHSGKKEIRVGSVYQEDEENIDIDSRNACSRGLHAATKDYPYYCGDTGLLVIVSPTKVRSVPYTDEAKMRVSEMFVACTLDIQNGEYMDEDVDVVPFDEEYHNISIKELEDAVKNVSFKPIISQNQVATVNFQDMVAIKDMLKDRVKNI